MQKWGTIVVGTLLHEMTHILDEYCTGTMPNEGSLFVNALQPSHERQASTNIVHRKVTAASLSFKSHCAIDHGRTNKNVKACSAAGTPHSDYDATRSTALCNSAIIFFFRVLLESRFVPHAVYCKKHQVSHRSQSMWAKHCSQEIADTGVDIWRSASPAKCPSSGVIIYQPTPTVSNILSSKSREFHTS